MGNDMFNDEQLAHAEIVQKETEDALGWWKDRALKAEAKLADKYLIEEQYEAACGDRDGLLRMVETLREWKDKLEAERDDIAAWAESWMKRVAAAERERDEARAAALVAVEERRSFQKAHDLSERHRGPLERVRSAAYDLFQALDWEAPGWRDETCAERGDATNKAWFELEAALNFAAECDSSHSRPAPPAPRGEFAIIASLVAAMKRWGSEEDGVPDFAWKAYTAGAAYIVTPPPPSDNKGCAA